MQLLAQSFEARLRNAVPSFEACVSRIHAFRTEHKVLSAVFPQLCEIVDEAKLLKGCYRSGT